MSKLANDMIGKSWDEFIHNLTDLDDDQEDEGDKVVAKVNPGNSNNSSIPRDIDQPKIPENLAYLFRRYPMEDRSQSSRNTTTQNVTKCNYCERFLSSTYIDKHVGECEKIPQVVKDELHVLIYGRKPRSGPPKKSSSAAGIKTRLPISATVTTRPPQSCTSTELHLLQPTTKPIHHSVNITPRTCSSAPSSPTGPSSTTQPLVVTGTGIAPPTANNPFPTIKIEKSDSPGPVDGKPKPMTPTGPPTSLKPKKTTIAPQQAPPGLKIKPSVVLKIKGNTSTTTTSPVGRITLHAAPSEPPCPSPAVAAGDVNENVSSPKAPLPASMVHFPQASRGLDESFLPSVVASLGLAQPRVSIKSLDVITEASPPPKKKRSRRDARKVIPLRDRSFNPNEHCGVIGPDGIQCKRSLTCKTHSMAMRRAVPGRSQPFDILISTQKQARDKAKLAKQDSLSSPTSPTVGSSPLVGCSASSGDGSSDASRLSIPVPTPPAVSSSTTQPRNSPAPTSTMTLQSLLNSGIQFSEATGPPFTVSKSERKVTSIPMVPPKVVGAPPMQLVKKVKILRDSSEMGIKLQSVPKEPEGFDCVTQIIPPDEEVILSPEDSALFDPLPFLNGKNILLVEESAGNLLYESIPLVPIPVGRRKKQKFKRSGSSSHFVGRIEENLPTKKFRRDTESSADRILFRNWTHDPMSETLTLTRGDEGEGSGIDGAPPPQANVPCSFQTSRLKLSFWLHRKEKCRPHHAGRRANSHWVQGGTSSHVGPLTEMTQVLNGLSGSVIDYSAGSQPLTSFEPNEITADGKGGGEPTSHLMSHQQSSKSYEENGRNWMGVEPNRNVDAPVADSELSKLLAAQFEDY